VAGGRTGVEQVRGALRDVRVYAGAGHQVFNETHQDAVLADRTAFVDEVPGA